MLVMKFGGTSVGSAERFDGVFKLVENVSKKHGPPVVVLSAMSGVTNALIDGAQKAVDRDLDGAIERANWIKEKHLTAIDALVTDKATKEALLSDLDNYFTDLQVLYKGISYLGELTKRSLDAVSGLGELMSSKIFSAVATTRGLKSTWFDARQLVVTDDNFGRANPMWEETTEQVTSILNPCLKSGKTVITQGFIAATESGASTTLGRGGSDFSASIFGVALGAEEIQIWTDVDGMMSADPRVVPEATVLPEVSFHEASELAYFGAKVLHPLTIKPAVEKNIPVKILNTMKPDVPGTAIKAETTLVDDSLICAIASKKGITALFIHSPRMLMAHGFLAKVFQIFDRFETPIDLIATSEVSISLTTDRTDALEEVSRTLEELGEVEILRDVAIVTVVGRQFREKSGIAAQVFNALSDINILMISGGASDINLSFVVSSDDADKAVKQLHRQFFKSAVNAKS